jgi:hypothetical protein
MGSKVIQIYLSPLEAKDRDFAKESIQIACHNLGIDDSSLLDDTRLCHYILTVPDDKVAGFVEKINSYEGYCTKISIDGPD